MLTKARELAPSIVRTVTPYVVGILVTLLGKAGFDWEPSAEALVLVTAGVSAVYYAIVRVLETRGVQAWGWLLGLPKAPTYDATVKADPNSPTDESAAVASDLPEDTPTVTHAADPLDQPSQDYPDTYGSKVQATRYDPKHDRPRS
jgi:hypothetical protein